MEDKYLICSDGGGDGGGGGGGGVVGSWHPGNTQKTWI